MFYRNKFPFDTILQGHCCCTLGLAPLNTVVIGLKKYKQAGVFFHRHQSDKLVQPDLSGLKHHVEIGLTVPEYSEVDLLLHLLSNYMNLQCIFKDFGVSVRPYCTICPLGRSVGGEDSSRTVAGQRTLQSRSWTGNYVQRDERKTETISGFFLNLLPGLTVHSFFVTNVTLQFVTQYVIYVIPPKEAPRNPLDAPQNVG